MIERTRYLEGLIARKHNGMVKVITGVRRCGKSVLLTKLFRKHLLESGVKAERIVDIALDKRKFAALQDPDRLSEYIAARTGVTRYTSCRCPFPNLRPCEALICGRGRST